MYCSTLEGLDKGKLEEDRDSIQEQIHANQVQ